MIDTMSVVASRFEVIRNGAVTEHNLTAVGMTIPPSPWLPTAK